MRTPHRQAPSLASLEGCLLGTAVGDALGLPAEGLSADKIRRRWGGVWSMRFVLGRGMLSDDTEHTFAVARALSRSGGSSAAFQHSLAGEIRPWFLALPAGVGMATARACLKLCLGFSPSRSGVFSAGNGPAMRSAIIGAYFAHDEQLRTEFVRASTRLTHTDPKAEAAAQAAAAAAACASTASDPEEFAASLIGFSADPEWLHAMRLLLEHLRQGKTTSEYAAALGLARGVTGYAFHSVPVAVYGWLRHPDDFRQALSSVLDCGGDTDTTGAILGGIAGAGLGADSIPEEWSGRISDLPLSVGRLRSAAKALAQGDRIESLSWMLRLTRNMIFLCLVLCHGIRRLLPF